MGALVDDAGLTLYEGDCRAILPTLPEASVHCVVTSPPYWGLRDYGVEGQIGLELTPEAWLATMVDVFREVRRVLRDDGTLWLNLGDSYNANHGAGFDTHRDGGIRKAAAATATMPRPEWLKPKDLVGQPWRLALALQADGWYLRSDIIWHKPNPMPESVTDRPTKAHEYVFLLTKSARYFYDADAVREPWADHRNGDPGPARTSITDMLAAGSRRYDHATAPASNGRNLRSVWTIPTAPYPDSHFATFPPELARRCIVAGTSAKGCCPACGAPWVREVEAESRPNWRGGTGQKHDGTYYRPNIGGGVGNDRRARRDLGWGPTCDCGAGGPYPPVEDPVPCTVLDPFAGSGTVGEVAEQNGRHALLLELSPAYPPRGVLERPHEPPQARRPFAPSRPRRLTATDAERTAWLRRPHATLHPPTRHRPYYAVFLGPTFLSQAPPTHPRAMSVGMAYDLDAVEQRVTSYWFQPPKLLSPDEEIIAALVADLRALREVERAARYTVEMQPKLGAMIPLRAALDALDAARTPDRALTKAMRTPFPLTPPDLTGIHTPATPPTHTSDAPLSPDNALRLDNRHGSARD